MDEKIASVVKDLDKLIKDIIPHTGNFQKEIKYLMKEKQNLHKKIDGLVKKYDKLIKILEQEK